MRKVLAVVVVVACGGAPDPTTAVSIDTARSLCQPLCQRDVTCNGNELEACLDSCSTGYGPWVRHDALAAIADCARALPCNDSDIRCHNEIEPLPVHVEWQSACRAGIDCATEDDRTRLCEVEIVTDPLSHLMRLTGTDIIDELTGCMDLATCGARLSCVHDVERDRGLGVL